VDPVTHQRRRLKAGWLSRRLWRRRLVFWLGAVAVGVIGVGFALASNWAQAMFARVSGPHPLAPLLITPLGFVLCAVAARRYFPGSQGSGIPHAIAARTLRASHERSRLLSPRIIAGKIALTVAGLLSGASLGREGPTVQIGAAIMLQVARWGHLQQERGLILAGSAAGIAAAFNTPLAGIVFAIEEMSRSFEQRTSGLVLYTVIIAGIAALALSGNYTYFGASSASVGNVEEWMLVLVCGVVGGLAGGAFSRLLVEGMRRASAWIKPQPLRRVALFALFCGLVVAVIGIVTGGMTYGTGYEQARAAVEGHPLPWYFWPAKLLATLATAVSGIPGGIFAPSLTVGAGLGDFIAQISGAPSSSLLAVLGMAGYFAGVVQAPLTAFVIILEMTGNHANVIPLMLASSVGFAASKIIAPEPLYHALAADIVKHARTAEAATPRAN
jgi:H+/Cl- antiporter ClcA